MLKLSICAIHACPYLTMALKVFTKYLYIYCCFSFKPIPGPPGDPGPDGPNVSTFPLCEMDN